jgi:DNA repair photolyase
MPVRVIHSPSRTLLVPQSENSFVRDFDYTLNPYGGCAFACTYCYVPSVLRGRAESLGGWGTYVEVRDLAPRVLGRQHQKLAGKTFFCASATDPWQPAERRRRITRQLLEILASIPFRFGLFSTRAPLVLRDVELLHAMRDRIEVGISVPTDREDLRRALEPKNPPAAARLVTASRLRAAGITVRLHVAPALPCSPDFYRHASEAADWVWLDWPAHTRRQWVALYRRLGIEEWLSRSRVEQETERWCQALGESRVKAGREWFARRFRQVNDPPAPHLSSALEEPVV